MEEKRKKEKAVMREGERERTETGRGYESGREQVKGHAKVILGGFSLTLFFVKLDFRTPYSPTLSID